MRKMIKILVLALIMLPSIMFAQSKNDSTENELSTKVVNSYRQLPAAHQQLILILLEKAINEGNGYYWVHSGDTIRNMEDAIQRYMDENGVTEVCGIPFGFSYERTKKILTGKFGGCDNLTTTEDCLSFKDKLYEGILFSQLSFIFESDGETNHLTKAEFRADTKSKEEAITLKALIDEKLSKRYIIYKVLDEGNVYLSVGGICPSPADEELGGYAITVDIEKKERPTRDGDIYAVRIIYGPYDY